MNPERAAVIATAMLTLMFSLEPGAAGERLTYGDLIHRLTDLESLATLPLPGEKCQQWSSYDRASQFDPSSGKYLNWDANNDGSGIIRQEGESSVFAEMQGPGVIWRIWSARAQEGHVKIYLDGDTSPAVDLPFAKLFQEPVICTSASGQETPFAGKALCHVLAKGWNCYIPIPFQKSCKIVGEKGWGSYYHFTYTTYPKDTELPKFQRKLSPPDSAALQSADKFLSEKLGEDPGGKRDGEKTEEVSVSPAPGQTAIVAELEGPRAISALRAQLDLTSTAAATELLRELCLRITWDNETNASVWAPLGDFFGAAPGFNEYRSLPLGMEDGGFYCLWYMPFAHKARIELTNNGQTSHAVAFRITHAPLATPAKALGRFHAKFHRDALLPAEPERRAIDWTLLKNRGRGRFVGVMLHVWNPRGGWWGEGDEKFFVDGEPFPSTIGTGSEDYFGYAWCCPELFQNAYHNQPRNDGRNRRHICVNRWHITDNVPFQTSFEAAIEKYFPNEKPTLYAATVSWYQAPGQADAYPELPLADRTGWYVEPPTRRVAGVLEGEDLKILETTGGQARPQDLSHFGGEWSDQTHLWWTQGKPGDRLTLALPVPEDGSYQLTAQLTKARDYGILQFSLDGRKLGQPLDLFHPSVIPTGPLGFGTHPLSKGEHRLTLEITGANSQAVAAYMAGLDYLKLTREPAP